MAYVRTTRGRLLGSLLLVFGIALLHIQCQCAHAPAPDVPGALPSTQPDISAIRGEYAKIYQTAKQYNAANPEMDRWLMNCEHCFLTGWTDEKLYEEVIAFVRRPGSLDFMFGHLLDGELSDEEILIDAEILIYAGEYRETYGEVIDVGKRAKELLSATESGRFISAEKRYPEAPIREKIENAARRSIAHGRGDLDTAE